ncbi:hypothetical protein M0805_006183 [Coniferiporia weirii]|nr:hypothetical protein M0805_006183 [Coniferiporia weirii]
MSMQKALVDKEANIELAYIDSGPVPGDTYTTLVCVHGHTYHAQTFSRLPPLAPRHNLRIIALNRRDYTGSTPFSPAELADLTGSSEPAHTRFLQARGAEIARFLVRMVVEKNLPRASADGKSGGLALLGWSLGNLTTMAFVSNLDTYPREVLETLEPYLRTFFMYELPDNSLGHPAPEGGFHPYEDPSIPDRMRGIVFGTWASSYYVHPTYASNSNSNSSSSSSSNSTDRSLAALEQRAPKRTARGRRACTLDTLTPDELLACVDPTPDARSERPLWRLPLAVLRAQTHRVLVLSPTFSPSLSPSSSFSQPAAANTGPLLPALKIRVVYGLASPWTVQWETWALERECTERAAATAATLAEGQDQDMCVGLQVRPIKFVPVKDANHFLHWDDAETFLRVCSEGIRN